MHDHLHVRRDSVTARGLGRVFDAGLAVGLNKKGFMPIDGRPQANVDLPHGHPLSRELGRDVATIRAPLGSRAYRIAEIDGVYGIGVHGDKPVIQFGFCPEGTAIDFERSCVVKPDEIDEDLSPEEKMEAEYTRWLWLRRFT